MIPNDSKRLSNRIALAFVAAAALLTGCGKESGEPGGGPQGAAGRDGGQAGTASATKQAKVVEEAQLAAITNQFAAAQQAQAELINKLLTRIDQLEQKEKEQVTTTLAAQQALKTAHENEVRAHEQRAQQFVRQIGDLEGKVGSLQAGRVPPEMALTPEEIGRAHV